MKKLYSDVSFQEVVNVINRIGDKVTVLVSGHTGTGKSSILKELAALNPNHVPCYLDVTVMDVGDFLIPKIRTLNGDEVCSFIPNESFGFHLKKPIILLLDEIGKASKSVMNCSLRLMLERSLGVYDLPEGSIVFATTNLGIEGLGDNIPPHARNRVCNVNMRKPTAEEWRWNYAQNAGVDPVVIASAIEYPSCFASFQDYEVAGQNQYIYDPRSPTISFVTPRSLEKASDILKKCRDVPEPVLYHLLAGVVGERFTADMMNILKLDNTMPAWSEIINKPDTTIVPPNGAAICLVVSKALSNVATDTFDSWMTYLNRLPREAQALFAMSVMSANSPKRSVAVTNRKFTEYAVENGYLFS
jgi:energy-coupling factor transporter ATP-binding protein EcfA2